MKATKPEALPGDTQVQGEGDYKAARRYDKSTEESGHSPSKGEDPGGAR